MIVLTIRTDKPEAEVGLFDDEKKLEYIRWQADRQLSSTLNTKIKEILISVKAIRLDLSSEAAKLSSSRERYKSSKSLQAIDAVVVYKGPGSFTGLRIGFSVANALAYSLQKPIVASGGENWLEEGIKGLLAGQNDKIALPDYGSPVNTTKPSK